MIYPQHKFLIEYLIEEVLSAGGDGDCTVYCKSGNAKELADLLWNKLQERHPGFKHTHTYYTFKLDESYIIRTDNESWRFTNNCKEEKDPNNQCEVHCF